MGLEAVFGSETVPRRLQPYKPRSRHARRGSAPSLALCLSIHAERPCLRYWIDHGKWLALSVAPPDRPARCTRNVSLLSGSSPCQVNAPQVDASSLQHEIQRTSTRRLFFGSGCRAAIGLHRLGDSQTHATPLVGCDLRWL